MRLVLYFAPGACSRVPLIALEEIGELFETRLIRFKKGDHRSAEYLALNPSGKVPTLLVDAEALTQNVAILTFLAKSFPRSALLPFSGETLADARLISQLSLFSSDLHPLVTRIRLPQFFCDVPGGPERVRELAESAMRRQLAPLEAHLAAQPWVLGTEWSLLDAYLYWVWFRITGAGFPRENFPKIVHHAERMESRPAVKRMLAREAQAEAELRAQGLAMNFDEMPSGPKA